MRLLCISILTLCLSSFLFAKGKKQPPVTITFHTEATDLESKKLTFEVDTPKGKRFMSKSPFIMTSDIVGYNTFPSPHNPEFFGCSFQLNRAGASRLKMTSGQYAGKWIMCTINGQVIDMLYIDRQIDGRVLTVWRGIDPAMAELIDNVVPRIGETPEAWKVRKKAEAKAKK
ncbi:hypothetical protein [Rubritalea sp.]|uniref:hypothetical protein n=1 Tax=Rubritalea sp. TaxID=2109375 RepID=UPI003EF414A4